MTSSTSTLIMRLAGTRRAIRGRDMIGYLNAQGSITITGSGLPAGQAAIALERVDALARTIRRAGHPASLRCIRADLFFGLLDGSLHHLTETHIITTLLTHPQPEDTTIPPTRSGR